ncbi:hypothetical protein GMOD_00006034 [Pyrenophora seminiperda CCB06]|uniref:Uncharacterized protein n=1 Tax=Pyrenophora seminiperda CCB06 TaxID=1302712 RepID=A0A3M7M491_9PLEO|nr:hypothetical protein GMOD_00006034 [Pyrenophora seminiperda CCB06]
MSNTYSSNQTMDMSRALFNGTAGARPSFERALAYGAGAIEAADERLLEEIKARRIARAKAKSQQQVTPERRAKQVTPVQKNQQVASGRIQKVTSGRHSQQQATVPKRKSPPSPLEVVDQELLKARDRRTFLENELKKVIEEEKMLADKKQKLVIEEEMALKEKKQKMARDQEYKERVKELEKVKMEKERKRKAAIAQKLEKSGGKPTGITKLGRNWRG